MMMHSPNCQTGVAWHVVWMILSIAVMNGRWCGVRGDQYDPTVSCYGREEAGLNTRT